MPFCNFVLINSGLKEKKIWKKNKTKIKQNKNKNKKKKQRNHYTPKSLTQRNWCNDLRERLSPFEREITKLDALSMLQFVSLCKLFEIVKNQKQQITLRLLFFLVHFFSTAKQSNNKYYYGLTRCKIKEIPLILLIESINLTRNPEKYRKKKSDSNNSKKWMKD